MYFDGYLADGESCIRLDKEQHNISARQFEYYMYHLLHVHSGLIAIHPPALSLPQKDLLHPNQLCIATTDFDGQEESVS